MLLQWPNERKETETFIPLYMYYSLEMQKDIELNFKYSLLFHIGMNVAVS